VTVWANGNDGGDGSANLSNPPGQDPTPGVISVASYNDQDTGTRDGTVSGYSSRGLASDSATWPDISAPGENITSSCRLYLPICATGLKPQNGPGLLDVGTFNTISGTSMAAPHITGIVAQLFQANPDATAAQVEAALKSTAYKYTNGAPYSQVGAYTSSHDKGTGLVDVVAAAGSVAGP
jgi:serine protease AprX